ncbi:H-2 class II histocompatibility antigen E-S beta chain-like [Crotalus adamanteus]|uniref:H-2 class II histocompatibility antigen E-S beta chain-like n=1 Tax=Crotalus adamanteus TaxID=8729 RepID=A0AAW1BUW3_CROAD
MEGGPCFPLPHFPPPSRPPPRGNPAGTDGSPSLLQGAPSGSPSRQVSRPSAFPSLRPSSRSRWERWALESLLRALFFLLPPPPPAAHFLLQWKSECHFSNGTQRVRFLDRDFYDRQEIDYYDSDLGKYVAVTPLGQPIADQWNSDKAFMQYKKAQVDRFCRHNYETAKTGQMVGRRAKPTVSISPTKLDPASPNTILLCIARGFYPVKIEIRWLKNGRPEEEGVAFGDELQNGDWTYQLQVMLETQPQWGDVYACQVEHASLEAPITVQWAIPIQPPAALMN